MDERTSTYLQNCLDELVGAGDSDLDQPLVSRMHEYASANVSVFRELIKVVVDEYEDLSSGPRPASNVTADVQRLIEIGLDDYFSRALVSRVPEIVNRLMTFERLRVRELPSDPVRLYLREAIRCYVLGLVQACIALTRAALEQALRERIPYANRNLWSLDELIEAARRFKRLSPEHLQLATDVRHIGNQVLHRSPCADAEACEGLVKTRLVIETLYGLVE